jgi:cation transport ATPase
VRRAALLHQPWHLDATARDGRPAHRRRPVTDGRHAGRTAIGVIGVADRERDGAAEAVADRRNGVDRVTMLTGDV